MDRTILYVQAGEGPAEAVKSRFPDEDITFFVAKNAEEAFEIFKHNDIVVVLVDSYLSDMKLYEFIKKVTQNYPNTVINVCLDMAESKKAAQISDIKGVKRIYLAPWEIETIEEGLRSSLDAACLERDFAEKARSLEEDEEYFEVTLTTLKTALLKQRYSYYKLNRVMKPFLESFISISEENSSLKKSDADEPLSTEERKNREIFTGFVRVASEKMLRLMTTQKLSAEGIDGYLESELRPFFTKDDGPALGKISSCVMGEPERNRLVILCFGVWFAMAYQGYRLKTGTVSLDSSYLSTAMCRYTVIAEGEKNADCPAKFNDFVENIIAACASSYQTESEGNTTKYKIDFEV